MVALRYERNKPIEFAIHCIWLVFLEPKRRKTSNYMSIHSSRNESYRTDWMELNWTGTILSYLGIRYKNHTILLYSFAFHHNCQNVKTGSHLENNSNASTDEKRAHSALQKQRVLSVVSFVRLCAYHTTALLWFDPWPIRVYNTTSMLVVMKKGYRSCS